MVAIVVTLLLYKKRVAAEKRAVLEHKAAEIRNRVASILSLGGDMFADRCRWLAGVPMLRLG